MCPQPDPSKVRNYFLDLAGQQVHVSCYGNGPQLLITLHGYDYDGSVFAAWASTLGDQYTLCAPDLPFHGQTSWRGREFRPETIQAIITAIAHHEGASTFHLAGHSLGARLLVCTGNTWVEQVTQFILLAPAGIGSFDRVPPLWMQRIAEKALAWPLWLKFLVNLGSRLKLVSNFHRRYAEVQLFDAQKRQLLFRTYNSLRHLRTTRPDRKQFWEQTTIPTLVVLAEQDRFVPNGAIKAYFLKNKHIKIVETPGNHDLVNEKTARVMLEEL
ncbi:alpha/beta fold hydrolase [Lewinella sp. LCG006]|uniref:alpha/beta fold hydrolase n=1 Tax=Lewinella sp. LCG006 TaxID=3231911 RepID=UPI003460AB38